MVSDVMTVCGFCLTGAILAVLIKQYSKEQSMMTSLIVCIIVFVGAINIIGPLLSEIEELFVNAGVSSSYITLVFKATAICFVTQIASDICKDSGETAIASVTELFGKVSILLMSLPLIENLVEIMVKII